MSGAVGTQVAPAPASASGNAWIRAVLGLVLATGVLALVLEASSLDFGTNLRRAALATGNASAGNDIRHFAVEPQGTVPPPPPLDQWMLQSSASDVHDSASTSSSATTSASVSVGESVSVSGSINSDTLEVPADELYHLSLLHGACKANKEAIVTWEFGAPGPHQDDEERNRATLIQKDDPDLLAKLRQCPDVDLFLPSDVRGNGYCEDSMAYTKFLHSRLLPKWALEVELFDPELGRKVDYFDLCPRTPVIFFQHYWEDVPSSPRWPEKKPVYLMPNIEMWELDETFYWRADVVLCKTRVCQERVEKWYEQEGNPRQTQVLYTKHTSSDQAGYARRVLGDQVKPKDFNDVRFVHTVGGSYWKGTRQVIECWLSRPDFPPLDLFVHKWAYDGMFKGRYEQRIPQSQITLHTDEVDALDLSKMVAETAYFLCPSQMEGYGHYMNQARASGGVVITSDLPPMNELIPSDDMGLRVQSKPGTDRNMFLGGKSKKQHSLRDVDGMVAVFSAKDLCQTVDHLMSDISIADREAMGANARRLYHEDTKFFAREMRKLRVLAQQQAGTYDPSGSVGDSSSRASSEQMEVQSQSTSETETDGAEASELRKHLRQEPDG